MWQRICLCFFLILSLAGCAATSSTNQITEVGNPTGTTVSGVTKALSNSMIALPEATSDALPGNLVTDEILAITTDDGFVCTFDRDTRTETCACPNGGSLTHVFTSTFDRSGGTITFNGDFETTFSTCALTTCQGQDVTITGDSQGSLSGSYSILTQNAALTASFGTTATCSGITANADAIGYDLSFDLSEGTFDFDGNSCLNGTSYAFSTLDDLQTQVDPENACGEDF